MYRQGAGGSPLSLDVPAGACPDLVRLEATCATPRAHDCAFRPSHRVARPADRAWKRSCAGRTPSAASPPESSSRRETGLVVAVGPLVALVACRPLGAGNGGEPGCRPLRMSRQPLGAPARAEGCLEGGGLPIAVAPAGAVARAYGGRAGRSDASLSRGAALKSGVRLHLDAVRHRPGLARNCTASVRLPQAHRALPWRGRILRRGRSPACCRLRPARPGMVAEGVETATPVAGRASASRERGRPLLPPGTHSAPRCPPQARSLRTGKGFRSARGDTTSSSARHRDQVVIKCRPSPPLPPGRRRGRSGRAPPARVPEQEQVARAAIRRSSCRHAA